MSSLPRKGCPCLLSWNCSHQLSQVRITDVCVTFVKNCTCPGPCLFFPQLQVQLMNIHQRAFSEGPVKTTGRYTCDWQPHNISSSPSGCRAASSITIKNPPDNTSVTKTAVTQSAMFFLCCAVSNEQTGILRVQKCCPFPLFFFPPGRRISHRGCFRFLLSK